MSMRRPSDYKNEIKIRRAQDLELAETASLQC